MSSASSKLVIPSTQPLKVRPWGITAALLVAIVGFILSQVLAQIILSIIPAILGWSTAEAEQWLEMPGGKFAYVLLAEVITTSMLVWFIRLKKVNLWQALGLTKPGQWALPAALLGFVCYIAIYAVVLACISSIVPIDTDQEQAIGFARDVHGPGLAMAFIGLVILPPLVEEIVFRGFLYGTLRRRNVSFLWSTLIVSLVFGTMHLFGGSSSIIIWIAFLDTFVLSIVLCYLREKTGSVWASIGVHALKNAFVFVNLFIISNG